VLCPGLRRGNPTDRHAVSLGASGEPKQPLTTSSWLPSCPRPPFGADGADDARTLVAMRSVRSLRVLGNRTLRAVRAVTCFC
jgi:hypothetical protein